ncbi:MAG: SRPBCC family protein [Candidatus Acidiferrum sp.]
MSQAETLQITTPTDREILITRVFDAPRRPIFEAWTNSKQVPHWMLGPEGWTMPVCEIDLRPGGAWHFIWHHQNGEKMEMHGEYREIKPPERLVSTECWGGDWPETLNTLVLTEENDKTTAALTILYPSKKARDAGLECGMKDGMVPTFSRLDALLRSMQSSAAAGQTSGS